MALSEAGGLLADVVAPIRYAVRGGELATDLRRYKSERCDPAEAALAAGRLRELLARFLASHSPEVWRAAGMAAGPSAVAVVPSGQGRPGAHPLVGLVSDCVGLPPVRLSLGSGEIHTRGVNPSWLRVHTPVRDRDVLVVDDTWVSGGSAQSTAAALKLAAARRVAIVVLGRHVNPDDPRSAPFLLGAAGKDFSAWCPPEPDPFVSKAGQLPERKNGDCRAVRLADLHQAGNRRGA